jgi:hypothetical protein
MGIDIDDAPGMAEQAETRIDAKPPNVSGRSAGEHHGRDDIARIEQLDHLQRVLPA